MKSYLVTLLCILTLLGLTAVSASALEPVGTPVPDVVLSDMESQMHSLKDLLKDKVGGFWSGGRSPARTASVRCRG